VFDQHRADALSLRLRVERHGLEIEVPVGDVAEETKDPADGNADGTESDDAPSGGSFQGRISRAPVLLRRVRRHHANNNVFP
jgi:hypothetical protein